MNRKDFGKLLKAEFPDLNVTHRQFDKGNVPPLPWIIYYKTDKPVMSADNKPYFVRTAMSVELYTEWEDEELESRLEAFFYAQNITPTVTTQWWDDEQLHEVLYEFEIF